MYPRRVVAIHRATPSGSSEKPSNEPRTTLKIKLSDGKEREIQHTVATSFWNADGQVISAQEFIQGLFGALLPECFKSEEELRALWSNPQTRKAMLAKLAEAGFGKGELDQEKLPHLLHLKYQALPDATAALGTTEQILATFTEFQKFLYRRPAA